MEFEYHDDLFFILPMLGIQAGECEYPECESSHYQISIGWLCWSINIVLS